MVLSNPHCNAPLQPGWLRVGALPTAMGWAAPACLLLTASAAGAQQQTIITFSSSQGRSNVHSSRVLTQSVAASNPAEGSPDSNSIQLFQNVRPVVRPDGTTAYEIIDINQPFSSYSQTVTREREQSSATRSVNSFSSFGYSVFHP